MNLTSKIIASVAGSIVLALGYSLFCIAGQNSELQNELSRTKSELTSSKRQVKALESVVDQAHDRIGTLSAQKDVAELLSSRKITRLENKLDFCAVHKDFIFKHYAPKRVQENVRRATLASNNEGHTEDPLAKQY